jgi:hypothetical protein
VDSNLLRSQVVQNDKTASISPETTMPRESVDVHAMT